MTTTTEETDEFTKRRIVSEGAELLSRQAYMCAEVVKRLMALGLSVEQILTHVETFIKPREMGCLRVSLVDLMGPLLSLMVPLLEGADEPTAWAKMASENHEKIQGDPMFARAFAKMETAIDRVGNSPPVHMKATIKRLFSEATSPIPDQAPALECWILLHGLPTSIHGSLSETPEGELRMLSPAPAPPNSRSGSVMMVEQFFCYSDVLSIAVQRAVDVVLDEPRIIRS